MTAHTDKKLGMAGSRSPETGPDYADSLDCYRMRAIALRNKTLRDDASVRAAWVSILTIVGVFTISFLLAAAPMQTSNGHAAAPKPIATSIR